VAKAEILRLIYQGRFLHSNVTLGALGLPFGKTTVMHLVPRENLPEPNSHGTYAGPHYKRGCHGAVAGIFVLSEVCTVLFSKEKEL